MTKGFLFPDKDFGCAWRTPFENGERRCFSPSSFAVFERSGFAAFGILEAGCAAPPPPPPAARLVRTNSSILHQTGMRKPGLAASLRSAARAYCIFGLNSNLPFRIWEKGIFGLPLWIRS